jgi:nucleosome assembly protein 1-like 1
MKESCHFLYFHIFSTYSYYIQTFHSYKPTEERAPQTKSPPKKTIPNKYKQQWWWFLPTSTTTSRLEIILSYIYIVTMPRRRGNNDLNIDNGDDDDDDDDVDVDVDVDDVDIDEDDDIEEEEEDPLAHLPDYVMARVAQLQALHTVRDTIMEDYLKERAMLEKKYETLLQPIYADRASIIQGTKDVDDDNTTATKKDVSIQEITAPMENIAVIDDPAAVPVDQSNMDGEMDTVDRVQGIPQFWACAMTRLETVGELLTVEDLDCLEYLMNISCSEHEDGKGFTLSFAFAPNEYFSNTTLTKTYMVPNILISDEPILKEVKGETIYWKTGKSLTHKTVKKKQRGKGRYAGQVRSVSKQEEKESFFHWFTTPAMPTSMDDMDEEEAEQLEELFESDFEIAQAFRCNIIPNAVLWFSGQVCIRFIVVSVAFRLLLLSKHSTLFETIVNSCALTCIRLWTDSWIR